VVRTKDTINGCKIDTCLLSKSVLTSNKPELGVKEGVELKALLIDSTVGEDSGRIAIVGMVERSGGGESKAKNRKKPKCGLVVLVSDETGRTIAYASL
jgi:hypothetical protein